MSQGGNSDPGIVEDTLGADGTPTYASSFITLTTAGRGNFFQWFQDVPEVNERTELDLPLSQEAGTGFFVFTDSSFSPIDGRLLGNEGREHNFHFTLQVHSEFDYVGGERLSFRGDDDLWVFVNGHLVIDLGGTHPSLSREVELDAVAPAARIVPSHRYPFDLFFAERQTSESNFALRSSLAVRGSCPPL